MSAYLEKLAGALATRKSAAAGEVAAGIRLLVGMLQVATPSTKRELSYIEVAWSRTADLVGVAIGKRVTLESLRDDFDIPVDKDSVHFTADFPVLSRSMLAVGTLPNYSKMTLSDVIKETVNRANQVKHLTELHDEAGWKVGEEAAEFTRTKFDGDSPESVESYTKFLYSLLIEGEYETALQKNEAVFPYSALGELLSFPKQAQQIENALKQTFSVLAKEYMGHAAVAERINIDCELGLTEDAMPTLINCVEYATEITAETNGPGDPRTVWLKEFFIIAGRGEAVAERVTLAANAIETHVAGDGGRSSAS